MTGEAVAANGRTAASAMRMSLPGDFWGALAGMIGAAVLGVVAPLISREIYVVTRPMTTPAA